MHGSWPVLPLLSLLSRMTRSTSLSSKRNCSTQASSNWMTCSWAKWRRSVVKCRRLGRATGSPKKSFALCVRTLKLSFWTYLHWLTYKAQLSHEAADAAWKFKLDCLTNSKLTDVHTKADVSEFLGLIRSMLKMNPGSRPSAVEVLQHPWFARGKLLTREISIWFDKHDPQLAR